MKKIALTSLGLCAVALAGCVKVPTAVPDAPEFQLRATVTPDNHCTVEALGQTYKSIGQVRGAQLPDFKGDFVNAGYHAIGCWVANVDGSGADNSSSELFDVDDACLTRATWLEVALTDVQVLDQGGAVFRPHLADDALLAALAARQHHDFVAFFDTCQGHNTSGAKEMIFM